MYERAFYKYKYKFVFVFVLHLIFSKTLGSPMVVMSVWKSFVATNPDALWYFTIYNWRRWNRIVIVTGVHVIVKYALRYFTITCTGKDQALPLQLACTITAALQLTAMLWLNTFHNSTFRLFRISNTHARLQACKVHSVYMHHALYTVQCMCIGAYRVCNLTPNPIKFCQQINRWQRFSHR